MHRPRQGGRFAPLLDGSGHELAYHHFTSVIRADRKFPLITAVNIDGRGLVHPGKRKDTWRRDARIDEKFQPDGEFYEKAKGSDPVQFSRGHQVRLLDPCWSGLRTDGAETRRNRQLEPKTRSTTPMRRRKFRPTTTSTGGIWKTTFSTRRKPTRSGLRFLPVRSTVKMTPLTAKAAKTALANSVVLLEDRRAPEIPDNKLAAAAFIVGQTQYVQALYEAKVFSGLKPYTVDEMRKRRIQTTIEAIEAETGLDFSAVRPFDAQGTLESTRQTRWINDMNDIVI